MLLRKYQVFRSKDLQKFESHLRGSVAGEVRSARLIPGGIGFQCNAVGLDVLPICYLESDLATTLEFRTLDCTKIVFQTNSDSRLTVAGTTTDVGARGGSYIISEGQSVIEEHPFGYRSLAVRIDPTGLKQKLTALCGVDVSGPVVFETCPDSDQRFVDFVRRPLFAAARELDVANPIFQSILLREIKEITLTRLLMFAPHNFSKLFEAHPRALGRPQMKRAEEYIEANWDKSLDVAKLADAVGVSARTILRHFRAKYGETPRDYIRWIRLDRARRMLLADDDSTTVVGVALKCGFSSLGHFAESYRSRFGELPSETLRSRR